MDNDFLQKAQAYLDLQKMRKAGVDVPMEGQLTDLEKDSVAPVRPPEQLSYKPDEENASPEQLQQFADYQKFNIQPSIADQLKPFLPQRKPDSLITQLSNSAVSKSVPVASKDDNMGEDSGESVGNQVGSDAAKTDAPEEVPFKGLEFGQNGLASQAGLLNAQEHQKDLQFLANMNRSFAQVAQGLAKSDKLDTSVADSVEKQGAQQVPNYLQQVDFQKQDPNSPYSQGLKDYFKKKLGMEIRGDASAAELEKLMPMAVKEFEAKEGRGLKLDLANEKMGSIEREKEKDRDLKLTLGQLIASNKRESGDKKASTTDENKTNADFMKMAEKLSAAKASSRSAMGKAALNKAAAERIETLVADRDLNSLDTREIQELARSLDSLLAQGQPTISGSHELVPKTARGDAGKVAEYLLNQRQGAQAGSFLKQMIKTVHREKDLADIQLKKYKNELLPGYEHLEKKDPERYQRVLGTLTESAETPAAGSPEPKQDPKIQAYADAHFGGDYEKARVLLEKRGYGQK